MPEPYHDSKEQLERVRATLIPGEDVVGVFAGKLGSSFLGVTTKRVIFHHGIGNSVTSIPYRHIQIIEESSVLDQRTVRMSGRNNEFQCLNAGTAHLATQMILVNLLG